MSERFSPWTVVHLVFDRLAADGLHPVLGNGDPSVAAGELLRALGIEPGHPAQGDGHIAQGIHQELAELRAQYPVVDPDAGTREG